MSYSNLSRSRTAARTGRSFRFRSGHRLRNDTLLLGFGRGSCRRGCGSRSVVYRLSAHWLAHSYGNAIGHVIDELCRQSLRQWYALGILQPVLKMRSRRDSTVATLPDYVTLFDLGALLHLDAVLLQVSQQGKLLVAVCNQHPVAGRQYVFRPARHAVGIRIGDLDNCAVRRRQHRLAIAIKLLVLAAVARKWTTVFQHREGHGKTFRIP